MKKQALLFFALSVCAFGQGVRVDVPPILNSRAVLVPNANISLCPGTATITNSTCSPASTQAFTDITLTTPCATGSPVVLPQTNVCSGVADSLGNAGFWLAPGAYIYCINGPTITGKCYNLTVPVGTTASSGIIVTAQSVNNVLSVGPGAGQYATCAAAVTAAGAVNPTTINISSNYAGAACPANYFSTNPNVTITDFRGTADAPSTAPGSGYSFGNYDDGNVKSAMRVHGAFNSIDATGGDVAEWVITRGDGLTVGTGNAMDGFEATLQFFNALTGTLPHAQGVEHGVQIQSTGGTITEVDGGIFFATSTGGSTTAVPLVIGVRGKGCSTGMSGAQPGACYGGFFDDQTTIASGFNFAAGFAGPTFHRWSTSLGAAQLSMEATATGTTADGIAHTILQEDNSAPSNTILRAATTSGLLFQSSAPANQMKVSSSGVGLFTNFFPQSAGAVDIGLNSNPFGNLWIGTAATNNFKVAPAATTQAITVNVADPGTPTVNLALELKATSAAFATATTAGTCVQNTTAVTGAATTMAVAISPVSTPGVGAVWSAFVSSAGNVTINECAVATSAGGTIAFNIRVFP